MKCRLCSNEKAEHHKGSFEYFGIQSKTELPDLCQDCHKTLHRKEKKWSLHHTHHLINGIPWPGVIRAR